MYTQWVQLGLTKEKKQIMYIPTLMLVYHCHKPVFTPKMAMFRRAGIRK